MMDDNKLQSNETSDQWTDLNNDIKVQDNNQIHNQSNKMFSQFDQSENSSNEIDLKSNSKQNLDEKIEDHVMHNLSNGAKSTDELLDEEIKIREQLQTFKQYDDESSKYESLDNSLSNQNLSKELNSTNQADEEFVELFGNPDLLKRIIKKGDEDVLKPERSCEVLINLEMRNQATNELIETECEQNLTILIGDFDVIHGVDLALLTMHKNEIAEILIKPQVGYGPKGKNPGIPSNCVVICTVELLKITWPNDMVCASWNALNHYFELAKRKKERGNFFFRREENATALHCYLRSGSLLDFIGQEMVNRHHLLTECESKLTDTLRKSEMNDEISKINALSVEYMKIKLDVFNNLSAVNIRMKSYNQALDAVENALRVNSDDKKALYRKSIILSHQGHAREAIDCIKHALRLEPNNRAFLTELNKLKIQLKKEIKEEKALYSKMLQTKAIQIKKTNRDKRLNYLTTGLVVSGVLLGSFILYRKFVNSS